MVDVGSCKNKTLPNSNYVEIFDTTLRDGSQTPNVNLTLTDKLDLTEKLDGMVDFIEGGWPYSNPRDKKYFEKVNLRKSKLIAFGMTAKNEVSKDENLKALIKSKADIACIVAKSWDLHVTDVLNIELEKNLEKIENSIKFLKKNGMKVFVDLEHYFDAFKENSVYLKKVLSSCKLADKIILCDTNGGAMPKVVERAVNFAKKHSNVSLGVHMHNDSGLALANTLTALDLGLDHIQGTVNGLGERCGNLDLCQIMPLLEFRKNKDLMADMEKIKDLSYFVERLTNFKLSKNHPFTGENAFKHKAGLHVDAVKKNNSTYEHMDLSKIGQKRTFDLSEQAGRANIVLIAKRHGFNLDKNDKITKKLLKEVKQRQYINEADLFLLLSKEIDGINDPFELKGYNIHIKDEGKDNAEIKLCSKGKCVKKTKEGIGPVHAFDKALRSSLSGFFDIEKVTLANYKVRILNEEKGTDAAVEVLIEFKSNGDKWYTSAVSRDVIKASEKALINGYKYYLVKKIRGDFN